MAEIIDLTYNINEDMITYPTPWHPKVEIERLGKIEEVGRNTRKIIIGTHTGTHIDAPLHFIENGNSIEKIPLTKLIGEVTIVDFSSMKCNHSISKEDISQIPFSKKILFKFGWEGKWNNMEFYENHPYFSKEAANLLVSKGVELIGYDTPSPDSSLKNNNEIDSPIHKIFLKNDIILLEYVANLSKIDDFNNWTIVVAPMKIEGSDGSPSRVFIYK
jgi:arylformamidase